MDTSPDQATDVIMDTSSDQATDLSRPINAPTTFMLARKPVLDELAVKENYLGRMQHKCRDCNALHFMHEAHVGRTKTNAATFSQCCMRGTVQLPPLKPTPRVLGDLLARRRPGCVKFLHDIRSYNCAFQMASSGKRLTCFLLF